jgi:hypothetical protein
MQSGCYSAQFPPAHKGNPANGTGSKPPVSLLLGNTAHVYRAGLLGLLYDNYREVLHGTPQLLTETLSARAPNRRERPALCRGMTNFNSRN